MSCPNSLLEFFLHISPKEKELVYIVPFCALMVSFLAEKCTIIIIDHYINKVNATPLGPGPVNVM